VSDRGSWLERNHFLLRRLHSLSGIVPVGAFLCVHLYTNSLAAWDPKKFDHEVAWIHDLPYLLVIELGGIILPLLFHAFYGVGIALQGHSNALQYRYADNVRYTLQRASGWIAFLFILVHLGHFRFVHWLGGEKYMDLSEKIGPFAATAQGFEGLTALWLAIYAVGLIASVYHFCNGICTFCITWGLTIGTSSRRYVSAAASGLAAVLLIWGFMSLYGLTVGNRGPSPRELVDQDSRPEARAELAADVAE
jgi:succinate dehydrogenase / fumarate reductase cytochrome b subunit